MALQRGSNAQLIMYEQTVDLLTAAVSPATGLVIPMIDSDLRVTADTVESRVLRGNRNPAEPAPNERGVSGGATFQPDVVGIGYLLKHFFGSVVTTVDTPSVGINTHTFEIADLPVKGLTFEKWFPSIPAALRNFGCKLNGMGFDVNPAGLLEGTLDIMGIDEVDPIPVDRIDATPFAPPVQGFRLPSVVLSEGGSGLATATRFSIDMTNNVEGLRTIGNLGRFADLAEGIFRATGSLSVLFNSLAIYQKAKAATTSALAITFPSPANPAHTLQLLFDEVQYSLSSPGITGPGGVIADLTWTAFLSSGSSAARAILTNAHTSYATIP